MGPCPCGGDAFAPEHGITDRHLGWLGFMTRDEAGFQQAVIDYATLRRWLVYHTHDSRRSNPGFPDLVLVRGERLLFREVKAEGGRLTPDQAHWLERLRTAGADADVWRPTDWPDIERTLNDD